jgi:putative glutamine amidotransferase
MTRLPIVGFPCDRRLLGKHPYDLVGEKYLTAVREGSQALPLLIPVMDPPLPIPELLDSIDGLLFTGSPSNVAPKQYGGATPRDGVLQDEHRDATALPLLKGAIDAGKPVLCICRGFQELNVALGGTLHQHLQEVEGRSDHRSNDGDPLDVQYGPVHPVRVSTGGMLARMTAKEAFSVNSLHSQGIDRLAPGLRAEAVAPDGQIEAVSMPSAKGFLFAVQWHPEWAWSENPVSRAIYSAFGDALRSA